MIVYIQYIIFTTNIKTS